MYKLSSNLATATIKRYGYLPITAMLPLLLGNADAQTFSPALLKQTMSL
jgi:hypothetical protein